MRTLALYILFGGFGGFGQALWIDVPFITQDKNGCGSASVWMLIQYWKQNPAPSLEEIHRQLFSSEAGGVHTRDMEAYLQSAGFRTFAFRGEWADLEQHIAKGRPLIVCLELSERGAPLHYVVVAGTDAAQGLVLVNDPARRKLVSLERAEFERAWRATENWTLLAVPEIDLAGEAFREEKYSEAKAHLRAALDSNPETAYTNELLATVYYLESNLESALKYWNRVGRPGIDDIRMHPPLRMKPVLLDRAFAFSRGSVLTLDQYRTTRARLQATGLFSRVELDLVPSAGDRFDVVVRAAERNGASVLSWFRGVAYQTVYPEFFNLGGKAVNVRSMIRWDSDRQRTTASMSAPAGSDPKWSYEVAFDMRRENWFDTEGGFRMHRFEASTKLSSVSSGRWTWTSGVAVAHRDFERGLKHGDVALCPTGLRAAAHNPVGQRATSPCFSPRSGKSVKYVGVSRQVLLNKPEHRFSIDSTATVEAGKLFGSDPSRFGKVLGALEARWLPTSRGDDYEMTARLSSGTVAGQAPFDELFILGLDRDSDLRLRATPARLNRRSFAMSNWDLLKNIRDFSLVRFRAGPFIDAARAGRWHVDTGLQLRVVSLGTLTASLSFGKNLSTGENVWFINTSR